MLRLRILTGRESGRVVEVTGDRFVVGSDPGCDLVLPDELVSPLHAAFTRVENGSYVLADLGSEGGTFVSTRRLRGPVALRGDEELCFGQTFGELSARRAGAGRRAPLMVGAVGLVLVAAAVGVLMLRSGVNEPAPGEAEGARPATVTVVEIVSETVPETATDASSGEVAPDDPAGAEEPAQNPAPTSVVYTDDFSDPSSGWEVFADESASGAYREGEYVMRIRDAAFYATADSGRVFPHAVVSVTARNPGRTANAGFGVICHYRGPGDYYVLAVGSNGTSAIMRREGASLRVLTGEGTWAQSEAIPVGASRYALRADCVGDRLRLWVNGRRVLSTPIQARPGRVGLFAAGQAEIRFDEFRVAEAAPPA